jgi:hypothetical protein
MEGAVRSPGDYLSLYADAAFVRRNLLRASLGRVSCVPSPYPSPALSTRSAPPFGPWPSHFPFDTPAQPPRKLSLAT